MFFLFRWRARARVVSGPDRPNDVPSYPAPPRPAPPFRRAPPRPDRPVVYPSFGFDRFNELLSFGKQRCQPRMQSSSSSSGTCRFQNPDIPRAGKVGAPGGAARRGRARLGANRTIRPGNKSPPFPLRHRRNVASTSLQKHDQAKSYINRRRNKTTG